MLIQVLWFDYKSTKAFRKSVQVHIVYNDKIINNLDVKCVNSQVLLYFIQKNSLSLAATFFSSNIQTNAKPKIHNI